MVNYILIGVGVAIILFVGGGMLRFGKKIDSSNRQEQMRRDISRLGR